MASLELGSRAIPGHRVPEATEVDVDERARRADTRVYSSRGRTPKVGKMNRKIRIASALVLGILVCAAAPTVTFAGSPLLSGYGGPGTGEQAIIGSTLIKGPRGGAGSNGSPGSHGSSGSGASSESAISSASGGSGAEAGAAAATAQNGTVRPSEGRAPSGSQAGFRGASKTKQAGSAGAKDRATAKGASAFVYPSALREASADSSAPVISGGDILVLAAVIATLFLLGVLTMRVARTTGPASNDR